MSIKVAVITVSDRAAGGVYEDRSGPALRQAVAGQGWECVSVSVVADDIPRLQQAIRDQIERGCEVVLTTGGTGIGPRDITPEAVRQIARTELPGFGETMRLESLKLTPNAILSRSLAAVVDRALVVCLPGKPSAATECLGFVATAIPHCVRVLQDSGDPHAASPGNQPARPV